MGTYPWRGGTYYGGVEALQYYNPSHQGHTYHNIAPGQERALSNDG
jgi:hypothetical protein